MRLFALICVLSGLSAAVDAESITFHSNPGRVEIRMGGESFATYVYEDDAIPRPYFMHVFAPNGVRVTREHPPPEGENDDHETMHPGIWMAFGDVNGADFWRNRARIRHVRFVEEPSSEDGRGSFAVERRYETFEGEVICTEICRYTIETTEHGRLLAFESTFHAPDGDVVFGDQEEMGLGFRIDTPFTVSHGNGRIRNAEGLTNEEEVWGKSTKWCEYSGVKDGERIGMVVMPHSDNFRPSWMHARDYGFLCANPFGRNAMTGGEKSAVVVKKGETLTLKYGLYVYSVPEGEIPDVDAVYGEYVANH